MKIDWDEFERTRGSSSPETAGSARTRSTQSKPTGVGFQQGAYFVLEALAADRSSIDRKLLADISRYVEHTLGRWRYNSRRLRRHMRI